MERNLVMSPGSIIRATPAAPPFLPNGKTMTHGGHREGSGRPVGKDGGRPYKITVRLSTPNYEALTGNKSDWINRAIEYYCQSVTSDPRKDPKNT